MFAVHMNMIEVTQLALNSTKSITTGVDTQQARATSQAVTKMEIAHTNQVAMVNGNSSAIFTMWNLPTRSLLSTTMLIIMTVAIVGNLLVITVILQNRGMRTRTNMFLCSLAISDFLCAILDMPFSLVTVLTGKWLFYENRFFCQLNGFLMPLFFINSTHTLMYIAIHKYVSIRYPFSVVLTERRVLMMIAAAWSWAAIVSTLTVTGLSSVDHKLYTTQCGPQIPTEVKAFSHLVLVLVTAYVVPLTVIICCYWSLFRHIREHGDRLEKTTTTDRVEIYVQQRRILSTLLLVVVVFIVSWTPWGVYSIYLTIIGDETHAVPLANPITYWCGYLNSACNPIIYAFRSQAFRDGYREALCRRKWKRFSVSTRLSCHIDNFRLSTLGYPWQLNVAPTIDSKSLVKVTKYCNIDEKRFSTCSLPVDAITVLNLPGVDTVCFTVDQAEKVLNGCDRQDLATPEFTNMTGSSTQSPEDIEGCSKTRVHVSKSCNLQPVSVDKDTSGVVHPHENSDTGTVGEKDDLLSGLCFRPRFRTLDWSATERSRHGIDPGWRILVAKETVGTTGDIDHGKGELNPGSNGIPADPCFPDAVESAGNPTEHPMDVVLSNGINQTEEIEDTATPKNWRQRLSTKWKRHSQRTSSRKYSNCLPPVPDCPSTSSNSVRRSVTIKPTPRRCPSVERLDHSYEPRKRTMTEVPETYRRRRRTGVDCLVYPSANRELDQSSNGCTTGVLNESEGLQGKKGGEEKGEEEKEWKVKEVEVSERPKETLQALAMATAISADCILLPITGIDDHPSSRLGRFLSHPCEHNSSFTIRNDLAQRGGTLR